MVSKKGEVFMEIKREDIPDNMINMLEIVGMENFLKISRAYGGYTIYIPNYKSLKKQARNREIQESYNGFNARELSQMYGLSVSYIYKITKDKFKDKY